MSKQDDAISFVVCRPIEEHARQVMEWRNDPTTLAMFYHHEPKIWATFWPEFCNTYFVHAPALPPLFALSHTQRIGFLKFSPVKHPNQLSGLTVDISINIAPTARGKGLGTRVLTACLNYLREQGVKSVYAEVLFHNTASIKAFHAAGFAAFLQTEKYIPDTGETHSIQCFLADLT